jgi:hypothetical protein
VPGRILRVAGFEVHASQDRRGIGTEELGLASRSGGQRVAGGRGEKRCAQAGKGLDELGVVEGG